MDRSQRSPESACGSRAGSKGSRGFEVGSRLPRGLIQIRAGAGGLVERGRDLIQIRATGYATRVAPDGETASRASAGRVKFGDRNDACTRRRAHSAPKRSTRGLVARTACIS
jgi:hypothetical protein